MDNIWSKIKKDSHYQQKEVQDCVFHLEQLQSIFMKFGVQCVSLENLLVWYFYKGLKLSIKLWIDEKDQELDS